ncbi:dipeptide/oligopeptide/nickel ABC transporter permease/ATP-binding protein [Actinomadura barringtoniae]|uniref:Dipeptide/oligopeptide/nickel ABC transporter permease/ATP-binding protein n=1 Tax=Actinomadura barringtoniae TaxID=1427535 RepID=A0A939T4U2_9ACTN|nr:dipeptide/oligopeptide/nickel ABC transporter permease/ATP-binding protein [Actinomadura barringtoniae]MBO2448689.1 dipeptide/oligopeptide/nickel ABC transporter permease/ATP-binding protein [Actinomadura barringtoniae]
MTFTRVLAAFRSPLAALSLLWLAAICLTSVFASVLAPQDPLAQDLPAANQGPTGAHLLGTDGLGRDELSRVMFGSATLLWGAAEATVIALLIGVSAGLLAGFSGKTVDRVLLWLADLSFALPGFIVIVALAVIYPRNTAVLMGALGVISAGGVLRFTRNLTRAVREELFVDAAYTAGLSRRRVMTRHILPVITAPLTVQAVLMLSAGVIVGASLSFLGLGGNPEKPSWGQMIYEASQQMTSDPWLMVPSGAALIFTVMALNFIGGSLGDLTPGTRAARGTRARARMRPVRSVVRRPEAHGVGAEEAAPPQDEPLLSVRGLTVSFPGAQDGGVQPVVDGVGFEVREGRALGLVGESGCGKSISVLAIPGLVPQPGAVTGGSIRFAGEELVGLGERQLNRFRGSRIGLISQEPMVALDPSFTVGSQLCEVLAHTAGVPRRRRRERCLELLAEAGIADPVRTAASYPHQLSGGMAQRAAIAMALAGSPQLLIADEPTTALDVTVQAEILDLLRELKEQRGMALLLVTHDLGVVADICDDMAVMYAGQVVEQGAVEDVLAAPLHPYTRGLLASTPESAAHTGRLSAIAGTVPQPKDWPTGCRFADRCPHAQERCRTAPVALESPVALKADDGRDAARCVRAVDLFVEARS